MNFEQQSEEYFIQDYTNDFNIFPLEQPYSEEQEVPSSLNNLGSGSSFLQVRDKRIKKNRTQRKVKKTDQSSDHTESAQTKQEKRKQRNRAAAQKSRDKQKLLYTQIVSQNREQHQQIEQLKQENHNIRQELLEMRRQLELYEQNSSQYKCISCQADVSMERVRTPLKVVSQSNIATYGIFAILAVVCLFGVGGIPGSANLNQVAPINHKQEYNQSQIANQVFLNAAVNQNSNNNQQVVEYGSEYNINKDNRQRSGNKFLENKYQSKQIPVDSIQQIEGKIDLDINSTSVVEIDYNGQIPEYAQLTPPLFENVTKSTVAAIMYTVERRNNNEDKQNILFENCTGPHPDECNYLHNGIVKEEHYTQIVQIYTESSLLPEGFYLPNKGDQIHVVKTSFDAESQTYNRQSISCNVTRSAQTIIHRNELRELA